MYPRHLTASLKAALQDTPVTLLTGARQVGKTTLVRDLFQGARYLTFDDASVLTAAVGDPQAFVEGLDGPTILDEVQRAPGVFRAIKLSVDHDRTPGRFLLTGSANALLVSRAGDDLVGRMEGLVLWPLSQGEISGRRESFVDRMFVEGPGPAAPVSRSDLASILTRGGYPEVVDRRAARRPAWFESYLVTMLQREVRDLAEISGLADLPRLLGVVAARSAMLMNFAEISRAAGIPQTTLKRYMALLEATYLIFRVPAWSANLGKRLTRSPKLVFADTGLAAHLMGLTAERLAGHSALGPLTETLVAMELTKQLGWSDIRSRLYHFRTASGQEVDLVLEAADGRIVGIEVKAAASIGRSDARGLRALQAMTGDRFHRGVVVYTGDELLALSSRITAVPMAALWS